MFILASSNTLYHLVWSNWLVSTEKRTEHLDLFFSWNYSQAHCCLFDLFLFMAVDLRLEYNCWIFVVFILCIFAFMLIFYVFVITFVIPAIFYTVFTAIIAFILTINHFSQTGSLLLVAIVQIGVFQYHLPYSYF